MMMTSIDPMIPWTPELEKARVDLCAYWLEVADLKTSGEALPDDLVERAIETEQALTILGEYANGSNENRLLSAASHALRSYQFHNASPDLAEGLADQIDAFLREGSGQKIEAVQNGIVT